MDNDKATAPASQGRVVEAQLDWLTLGWEEGQAADRAEAWAFSRGQAERRAGFREAPFRLMGYEGWAVGRVRFGRRDGPALLQLSGDLAEKNADTLVPHATRISRVDIAVTVRLDPADPFLGETSYAEASNHYAEHPASALPWIVQTGSGGCTAYVGSRTSDRFLRIYDEGAAHYKSCWRYELECKGTSAKPMALAVVSAADRPAFIQQQLHHYCLAHGIGPAFDDRGGRVLIPGFRRRSDTESRLNWIRRSVNPAILSLLSEVDRAEILDALGLGEASEPEPE
jgi:DNA relaxase NicK